MAIGAMLFLSTGCGSMFSADRNRARASVVRADMARIPDEMDFILGFEDPSMIHEDTLPPFGF